MSYRGRIWNPGGALNPPRWKTPVPWRLIIFAAIVAFVLVAVFRPQWLARIGMHVNFSGAAKAVGGGVPNPMRWV